VYYFQKPFGIEGLLEICRLNKAFFYSDWCGWLGIKFLINHNKRDR